MEMLTKGDLEEFRIRLLSDLKKIVEEMQQFDHSVEWLKSGDLRKMLKVSDGTLQNLRIRGRLKPVRIEGTWYYNKSEVMDLFKR